MEGPEGLQLPADHHLPAAVTKMPRLVDGLRANIGRGRVALVAVAGFWIFLFRTYRGFQLQVGGLAPAAARYAGFSSRGALWTALLLSGGMAGLAGGARGRRAAGAADALRAGRLRLRRHHRRLRRPAAPGGHRASSAMLMSMFYIGGELAQSRLGLPKSLTGVFQGLLLFTLLACDTLIHYRMRWPSPRRRPLPASGGSRLKGAEMDSFALLLAATLNAGTVLALAGAGPADQRDAPASSTSAPRA